MVDSMTFTIEELDNIAINGDTNGPSKRVFKHTNYTDEITNTSTTNLLY